MAQQIGVTQDLPGDPNLRQLEPDCGMSEAAAALKQPRWRRASSVSPSRRFEDEIVDVGLAADVVQATDLRMVERGAGAGSRVNRARKSASRASVGARIFGAMLRSSRVSARDTLRPCPGTDERKDLVGAKPCYWIQDHGRASAS